jgi:hypothetical protein
VGVKPFVEKPRTVCFAYVIATVGQTKASRPKLKMNFGSFHEQALTPSSDSASLSPQFKT